MKLSELIKKLKAYQEPNKDPEVILMPATGADECYCITHIDKHKYVIIYFEDDY